MVKKNQPRLTKLHHHRPSLLRQPTITKPPPRRIHRRTIPRTPARLLMSLLLQARALRALRLARHRVYQADRTTSLACSKFSFSWERWLSLALVITKSRWWTTKKYRKLDFQFNRVLLLHIDFVWDRFIGRCLSSYLSTVFPSFVSSCRSRWRI